MPFRPEHQIQPTTLEWAAISPPTPRGSFRAYPKMAPYLARCPTSNTNGSQSRNHAPPIGQDESTKVGHVDVGMVIAVAVEAHPGCRGQVPGCRGRALKAHCLPSSSPVYWPAGKWSESPSPEDPEAREQLLLLRTLNQLVYPEANDGAGNAGPTRPTGLWRACPACPPGAGAAHTVQGSAALVALLQRSHGTGG